MVAAWKLTAILFNSGSINAGTPENGNNPKFLSEHASSFFNKAMDICSSVSLIEKLTITKDGLAIWMRLAVDEWKVELLQQ